jgi:malonyl CoA-acyl carrier protein transacylase
MWCMADARGFMGFTHRNQVADPAVPVIVWPTQRAVLVTKHIHDVHSLPLNGPSNWTRTMSSVDVSMQIQL